MCEGPIAERDSDWSCCLSCGCLVTYQYTGTGTGPRSGYWRELLPEEFLALVQCPVTYGMLLLLQDEILSRSTARSP